MIIAKHFTALAGPLTKDVARAMSPEGSSRSSGSWNALSKDLDYSASTQGRSPSLQQNISLFVTGKFLDKKKNCKLYLISISGSTRKLIGLFKINLFIDLWLTKEDADNPIPTQYRLGGEVGLHSWKWQCARGEGTVPLILFNVEKEVWQPNSNDTLTYVRGWSLNNLNSCYSICNNFRVGIVD